MSFLGIFSVSLLQLFILSILVSRGTCALMDIRTSQAVTAQDAITPCSSRTCLTDPNSFVVWKTLRKWCPVFLCFGAISADFSSSCSTSTRLCVNRIAGRRPASCRTESDAPPEQVYSVRNNSPVWISLQGRVRFFQPVHGPRWCYDLLSRKDDTHKSRSIVSPRTFFLRGVWY